MERNMGTADRLIRGLVAAPVLFFLASGRGSVKNRLVRTLLGAMAVAMTGAAVTASCPIYSPLGVCTVKRPAEPVQAA